MFFIHCDVGKRLRARCRNVVLDDVGVLVYGIPIPQKP
jgi:hypothetical protein